MKSSKLFARPLALLAASTVLVLAGCGQKGPLYMPVIPPDPLPKPAPQSMPQPAPKAKDDAAAPAKATSGNAGQNSTTATDK